MTITQGYATRAELLREIMTADDSAELNAVDDEVLDDIITDASRAVDHFCNRQFYASAETLYFDVPDDRCVWFGTDVLAVQGASNGTGASVASGNYYLWPKNANSFAALMLTEGASVGWVGASSGNTEGVIAIAASVGYVDRTASTPRAAEIVRNTHRATLVLAETMYRERMNQESKRTRADWQDILKGYIRQYMT